MKKLEMQQEFFRKIRSYEKSIREEKGHYRFAISFHEKADAIITFAESVELINFDTAIQLKMDMTTALEHVLLKNI